MITALIGGIVAGLAVAVPVGAVGALIVMTGAHRGWRVAAGGGLGAATVDALYASLAVIGGSAVTAAVGSVATPLKWVAGLVLLTLGAAMLRSGWTRSADQNLGPSRLFGTAGRAYVSVFGVTAINPATVIYFAALVAGGSLVEPSAANGASFVLGVLIGSAAWQLVLAAGGSFLGAALVGDRGRRWTAIVGGGVTMLLAARILLGS
ncbi:LysE family transporter [Gordonia alkanivorans]|uniref:LysE family transporter n=1 Tax=Gordonia alkanivorans TaxID=84096 RepID=UPI0012DEBB53|nr:LysE family transporter [Gordonia alkanivorans]MDH3005669.1 LysE family transporter [Gordonia alkanivorans]MDH3011051.1 LysE family transporter [Gordonia alkanivorans]MDH3017549.1 LysE family transporter [Gordonia alkanivorans]MDH3019917.1 LysE family transporter [Gordonia alkanivorans]MDH3042968.1 LysE family transporter [Gordonia alkanivorans]